MADGKRPDRRAYLNQKQLREGTGEQNVANLSGDGPTDDRIDDERSVQEPHNALTLHSQLGGLFMHPMHDASADPQLEVPEGLETYEEHPAGQAGREPEDSETDR